MVAGSATRLGQEGTERSETFRRAQEGLTRTPKSLPPVLFYDARGSALFDEITQTPEYYLTRSEREILDRERERILDRFGETPVEVVELGAGSAGKTETLLEALAARQPRARYVPIDVSDAPLDAARLRLRSRFPRLDVHPVVGDNRASLAGLPREEGSARLVLFLGSSIGNDEPDEAAAFLGDVAATLRQEDRVLLGVDLRKDDDVLEAAYNDAEGVTASFNLNVLARLNRELHADFDLEAFRHRAWFNDRESRIEMHLESLREQVVRVPGMTPVRFAAGETIHTESSYKYADHALATLARRAGLEREAEWRDGRGWFSLQLLRRPRTRATTGEAPPHGSSG